MTLQAACGRVSSDWSHKYKQMKTTPHMEASLETRTHFRIAS